MVIATIIALVSILTMFVSSYLFWTQYKSRRALIGRRLVTILTPTGERFDKLLEVRGNQLIDHLDKTTTQVYMVRPDKSYDTWWPIDKHRMMQVLIKSFLYAEGNPEPIDPFIRTPVVTSEVLGDMHDINFSRAMVGRTEEIVNEENRYGRKKKFPILPIAIGAGVLLLILIGVVALVM